MAYDNSNEALAKRISALEERADIYHGVIRSLLKHMQDWDFGDGTGYSRKRRELEVINEQMLKDLSNI